MPPQYPVYLFDGWRFDTRRRELYAPDGREILLTTAEIQMLEVFCASPRAVISRNEALPQMLPVAAYERSVDVQVTRLRSKIEENPRHPRLIKTIRNEGYTLVPPVEIE